jgi:hypothetical protein
MTRPNDDWRPTPEVLAAYFDGELGDRPESDALRQRIADWLRRHPEARAELTDYARLAGLWEETTPTDPDLDAWRRIEERLEAIPASRPERPRRFPARRWAVALLATAAGVVLVLWLGLGRREAPPPIVELKKPAPPAPAVDLEVFPVATAAEVTILRVEGADTQTVVVGILPLLGPLELAGPGEVALTSVQPDARDQMLPHVRMTGSHRPMIWAPTGAGDMEP